MRDVDALDLQPGNLSSCESCGVAGRFVETLRFVPMLTDAANGDGPVLTCQPCAMALGDAMVSAMLDAIVGPSFGPLPQGRLN